MRGGLTSQILIVTGFAIALLAPASQAAVVTFPSTDVPKVVGDGTTATSAIAFPEDSPPATDIDLVGVRVSTPGGGSYADRGLFLFPEPNRGFFLAHTCTAAFDFDLGWDDSAASLFTAQPDCTAMGAVRYLGLNALLDFDAGSDQFYAKGTWTLSLEDKGLAGYTAPPSTLERWALRVTYRRMLFDASALKQRLRKSLELEAKCNGDCHLDVGGDAKSLSFNLKADKPTTLKIALRTKVKRRLARRGGKANIELEASNDIGDRVKQTVKVRIKR